MKFIGKLLLIILIILIVAGGVFFANGYNLYKTAISKESVSQKVASVREKTGFVSITEVPNFYPQAIVAVEDHRFYQHSVIDVIGICRAIVSNIKQKDFKEGGSTITQQTAKNLYFASEDDVVSRKIAEILIGIDLEKNYSKSEILELYFNTIYFGDGYYGVNQACTGYFNKLPKDMNISDATILAGIPNAPSVYAPTVNPELTASRQKKVISSMVEYGYLTEEEGKGIHIYEPTK